MGNNCRIGEVVQQVVHGASVRFINWATCLKRLRTPVLKGVLSEFNETMKLFSLLKNFAPLAKRSEIALRKNI